ncbi:MAG: glycosyltransferase family 2 protein [Thaumarchaeota archaeon]|nr:MAG: glycosyltransferase family 2 protein [Nitrososphaerota archaeon]
MEKMISDESHDLNFKLNGDYVMQTMHKPTYVDRSNRKLKLAGGFVISAFFILLSVKIFLLIFVIDPFVGMYGFISTFLIAMGFFFTFTRYKDPSLRYSGQTGYSPLVSIIIPAKNDGILIRDSIEGAIRSSYRKINIILVNDGSTDDTGSVMAEFQRQHPETIKVVQLSQNVGKRKAILTAIKSEKAIGDIIVLIDSDSVVESDAIERIVQCFNDPDIGAVTAHGNALNRDENVLTKMQDTWYDGSFFVIKGMESSFNSVTCCSGILSAYRKEAIWPCLEHWANDKFLGKEFRPGDDRHLTAYVFGGTKHHIDNNARKWKVVYCESARVKTRVPSNLKGFVLQQIRWKKSWVRVFLFVAPFFFKDRSPIMSLVYYLQMTLSMASPFVSFRAIILMPLNGHWEFSIVYIMGLTFISLMYAFTYKVRHPETKNLWLYRILVTPMGIGMSWLLYYAILTIRKTSWLTR